MTEDPFVPEHWYRFLKILWMVQIFQWNPLKNRRHKGKRHSLRRGSDLIKGEIDITPHPSYPLTPPLQIKRIYKDSGIDGIVPRVYCVEHVSQEKDGVRTKRVLTRPPEDNYGRNTVTQKLLKLNKSVGTFVVNYLRVGIGSMTPIFLLTLSGGQEFLEPNRHLGQSRGRDEPSWVNSKVQSL